MPLAVINKPIYDDMQGVDNDFIFAINPLKVKQKISERIDHHRFALNLLEMKCVWPDCKETDSSLFQIDHIFNNGKMDRRKSLPRKIIADYDAGVDITSIYQVLCRNHNWKKYILNLQRKKDGTPFLYKIYP